MKYIPSIAFEEMSGSAKGVTAAKMKNRKYIRNRGYGGSVRTSDQAKVKGIFKRLTTMWKTLDNDKILAWNKLALSQQGRSVLGTGAKISGANLFTRLNYWIVACGGTPVVTPPTLLGVENPSAATIVCQGETFTFKLDQALADNTGIYLVIEATEGQSNGVSRAHDKAATVKMVATPTDAAVDIRSEYVAKNGAPSAAAPKIFFRYYYVNSVTGEKSSAMLAEVKWAAAAAEPGDGDKGGDALVPDTPNDNDPDSGQSGGSGNDDQPQAGVESLTVVAPVINVVVSGSDTAQVTLSGPAGADLYYTTDGTAPTVESTRYVEPFFVVPGRQIKAIAVKDGICSEISSRFINGLDE